MLQFSPLQKALSGFSWPADQSSGSNNVNSFHSASKTSNAVSSTTEKDKARRLESETKSPPKTPVNHHETTFPPSPTSAVNLDTMPVSGAVQGQNPTQGIHFELLKSLMKWSTSFLIWFSTLGLVHWMSAVMAEHITSNTHHDPAVGMHYMWNGSVDVSEIWSCLNIIMCVRGQEHFLHRTTQPKRRKAHSFIGLSGVFIFGFSQLFTKKFMGIFFLLMLAKSSFFSV